MEPELNNLKRRSNMKKRVLSILLAATMVGTMIAGCGNSGGNSEGGSSDSGDGEDRSPDEFSACACLHRRLCV